MKFRWFWYAWGTGIRALVYFVRPDQQKSELVGDWHAEDAAAFDLLRGSLCRNELHEFYPVNNLSRRIDPLSEEFLVRAGAGLLHLRCPYCSARCPADDYRAQSEHMEGCHPEIVKARLAAARRLLPYTGED